MGGGGGVEDVLKVLQAETTLCDEYGVNHNFNQTPNQPKYQPLTLATLPKYLFSREKFA